MQVYDINTYGLKLYIHTSVPGTEFLSIDSLLFSTAGTWDTTTDAFTVDGWYHVAFTFDITSGAASVPIVYVNASSKALTATSTPAGTRIIGEGTRLFIGNAFLDGILGGTVFNNKIFDPRIYNRVLSASEITTLYNSGTPSTSLVTDGLVFQGMCVPTGKVADFVGVTLDDTYVVRDNIYGAVGRINGSPIGRAAP